MIQYPNDSLSLLGKVKTIKCLSKVLLSQMIFLVILMAKMDMIIFGRKTRHFGHCATAAWPRP